MLAISRVHSKRLPRRRRRRRRGCRKPPGHARPRKRSWKRRTMTAKRIAKATKMTMNGVRKNAIFTSWVLTRVESILPGRSILRSLVVGVGSRSSEEIRHYSQKSIKKRCSYRLETMVTTPRGCQSMIFGCQMMKFMPYNSCPIIRAASHMSYGPS